MFAGSTFVAAPAAESVIDETSDTQSTQGEIEATLARGASLQAAAPRRVLAVARNTFREAVRDRVLYNLILFVLLLTGAAVFLGELSAAQESKIIIDMGLSAMLLFGAFIAVFVGVSLVYKEIERRTIYAIFSKPVGRGEFLLGKYLGLCLTLAVNVAVMGVGVSLALIYVEGGASALAVNIWPAAALIYVELMILVAVALLFSSFSSPMLSALLTFFVFVIGHFNTDLKELASSMDSAAARSLFNALYYTLPNFSHFSYITAAAHGRTPSVEAFAGAVLYGLVYSAVLLSIASLIFKRRNFK